MSGFEEFWAAWPGRRIGKKNARREYQRLNPDVVLEADMIRALLAQQQDRDTATGWRPDWPHPATWIRGERWADEVAGDVVTPAELAAAKRWKAKHWCRRCRHEPVCEFEDECLAKIAAATRGTR